MTEKDEETRRELEEEARILQEHRVIPEIAEDGEGMSVGRGRGSWQMCQPPGIWPFSFGGLRELSNTA